MSKGNAKVLFTWTKRKRKPTEFPEAMNGKEDMETKGRYFTN